jgi:enamine deaminase RidA (YjgF/YER057c/UK114 family)
MDRQLISSGSPWEPIVGFSRAVRVGSYVCVSGTLATDAEGRPMAADAYGQATAILRKIQDALAAAGATLGEVIRTRMYLTDIRDSDEVARAHHEFFRDIRPAATMIEVGRLVGTGFLVEIEADAVVGT